MAQEARTAANSFADLCELLDESARTLRYLSRDISACYLPFDLRPVHKARWRHIDNPKGQLRQVQRKIHRRCLRELEFPDGVVGGVKGRSLIDNARPHLRQPVVVALDLKNCFRRISHKAVYRIWVSLGWSANAARELTLLTTLNGSLPQGSPTSNALANLALLPILKEVDEIAKQRGLRWTMWVDDLTISGPNAPQAIESVIQVIRKHGHGVRCSKKRVMPAGAPQIVTGLLVNEELAVPEDYLDRLRSDFTALGVRESISERELRGLAGRVAFVRSISESQAERLRDQVQLTLKGLSLPTVSSGGELSSELRRCNASRASCLAT